MCFVTGEPSGLAATLPPALAELKKIIGSAYVTGPRDAPAEYVMLADETVTIDGYRTARQPSQFENGPLRLQILTSDLTAPAAALAAWLRRRWRIENAFKYLSAHHKDHARVRPGRRLPTGVPRLPRSRRGLDRLPARPAGPLRRSAAPVSTGCGYTTTLIDDDRIIAGAIKTA